MGNAFSFGWENDFILFFQQFMSAIPVKIAGLITEFGDSAVLFLIVGTLYWSLDKEFGKKLVVSLGFFNIGHPMLKTCVSRLRPYMVNPDIRCLKPVSSEGNLMDVTAQGYSFPSGHSGSSFTVYGLLAAHLHSRRWTVLLSLLILLVGLSRPVLGVHYPTDVLGGWALALLCMGAYRLLERKIGRNRTFILLDILGLTGFLFVRTNDFYSAYGLLLGSTLGILFEEKWVNFEGTRKPLLIFLRTAVGIGLFLGVNALLKLPFPESFLTGGTLPALVIRAARYGIDVFLLIGIYPLCFRLFPKRSSQSESVR